MRFPGFPRNAISKSIPKNGFISRYTLTAVRLNRNPNLSNSNDTILLNRHSESETNQNWNLIGSFSLLSFLSFLCKGESKKVKCEGRLKSRVVDAGSSEDWQEGERREIDISAITSIKNDSILIHKLKGQYYCTSAKCSHFGVPLKFGFDNTESMQATCPAHDASFDIRTGEVIRGPTLKPIDTYPIKVDPVTGHVLVTVVPNDKKRIFAKRNLKNNDRVVIVGSGCAGYSCAETLRLEGYTGEIVMITRESTTSGPIDRTRLSKSIVGKTNIELRSKESMVNDLNVQVVGDMSVVNVDNESKTVTYVPINSHKLANQATVEKSQMKFNKILLATGGVPRQLFCPGSKLKNVFTLRNQSDNDGIAKIAKKGYHVVVVGGGFIGLEMATTLVEQGCKVTIIETADLPLSRVFGRKIGAVLAKWLHTVNTGNTSTNNINGTGKITFMGGTNVSYIRGDGHVSGVETDTGDVLAADLVVVATGVQIECASMQPLSSASRAKDGSFLVDPFMKIRGNNDGSLYAAGDNATFTDLRSTTNIRIEHWNTAIEQGKIVAKNMLGKYTPFCNTVPYFWSEVFGKKLKFVGSIDSHQHAVTEGDTDEMNFVVWYLNSKDEITGVLTAENPKVACAAAELLRLGKMPKASEVVVGAFNSKDLIKRLETLQRGEKIRGSVLEKLNKAGKF